MHYDPVLAIVIPVYNEQQNLPALVRDWQKAFEAAAISYRIIFIDDGSKDSSLAILRAMQEANPALEVHTRANSGHGPAILHGYRLAVARNAEWIFQIDSDHQLETTAFGVLWENREAFDLLIAERTNMSATVGRRQISMASRAIVRWLYGSRVRDVNCPYRLMRAEKLQTALEKISSDSFAPNVLISSWFLKKKTRIFTTVSMPREDGVMRPSKMNWYFFRGALQSAFQTFLFRIRL